LTEIWEVPSLNLSQGLSNFTDDFTIPLSPSAP